MPMLDDEQPESEFPVADTGLLVCVDNEWRRSAMRRTANCNRTDAWTMTSHVERCSFALGRKRLSWPIQGLGRICDPLRLTHEGW